MPGNVDFDRGMMIKSPKFRFEDAPLAAEVSALLGNRPTYLENNGTNSRNSSNGTNSSSGTNGKCSRRPRP